VTGKKRAHGHFRAGRRGDLPPAEVLPSRPAPQYAATNAACPRASRVLLLSAAAVCCTGPQTSW